MALHPKVIDLTLDRMWSLLEKLGNPQDNLPEVIHIAGTNGKGSTQAMIKAGLEAGGKTVHAYTSPHLARFHERIYLAGRAIDEDLLSALLEECETANNGEPITYFEITTCAALLAFSRVQADYLILEVGLGGRLDATNVIDRPAMAIITPVSLDHQQFLGDTLAEIAGEKAGILKRNCFGVISPQQPEALETIEATAQKIGATLKSHGEHWHVWEENGRMVFQDEYGLLDLPRPALIGAHQIENAGCAVAALRLLGFGDIECEGAVLGALWPARLQRLRAGPLIDAAGSAELWLDGGHNPAAGSALAEGLSRLPQRDLFLITGMLNTKDITGFMKPLVPLASRLYGVSIPGETATLSSEETVSAAKDAGFDARSADTVLSAIEMIVSDHPNARILICGSLYLAGQILQENG